MRGARQLLGAVALLALFLLVVVLVPRADRGDPAPPDGEARLTELVGPGLPEADLTRRGWQLDDGLPPTAVDGMRLVESVDLSFGRREGEVWLGPGWRSGGTRYAVLWCDVPRIDDPVVVAPTLQLTFPEDVVRLSCAGRDADPPVRALQSLPPVAEDEHATAEHRWQGDLPSSGTATLGIYLELYGAPPRAGRPLPLPTALPGTGVDSGTPAQVGADRDRHLARVEVGADTALELWAGDPGLLPVDVDGVVVTDDGDLAVGQMSWHGQDPEMRNGAWHVSTAGSQRRLELPQMLLPEAGQTRIVTLSVPSTRTLPRTWSVRAVPGVAAPEPAPLRPRPAPEQLPEAPGLRPLASWQVPRDGLPHELHPPTVPGDPETAAPGPETWVVAVLDPKAPTAARSSATTAPPLRGVARLGDRVRDLPVLTGSDSATGHLPTSMRIDMLPAPGWRGAPSDEPADQAGHFLTVVVAPAPGHPPVTVLAWLPDPERPDR